MRGNKETLATAAGNRRVSGQNHPTVDLLPVCTTRLDRSPHPAAKPLRRRVICAAKHEDKNGGRTAETRHARQFNNMACVVRTLNFDRFGLRSAGGAAGTEPASLRDVSLCNQISYDTRNGGGENCTRIARGFW
jgi:hypothetical protein